MSQHVQSAAVATWGSPSGHEPGYASSDSTVPMVCGVAHGGGSEKDSADSAVPAHAAVPGSVRGSVPPFDPEACGKRTAGKKSEEGCQEAGPQQDVWGNKGLRKLPTAYWNEKLEERDTSSTDRALQFLQMRTDRNGIPIVNKLGEPVKYHNGWWRLRIESCSQSVDTTGWEAAWHGPHFPCIYSVLFHGELLESRDNWNTQQAREGVYCHDPKMAEKAERYMVFELVFSDGAWWGTKLELLVDRERGNKVGDQWVQKADSVQMIALWLCGRSHEEMQANLLGCWFEPRPWDPKAEVNPHTVCGYGTIPLRAKQEQQMQKQHAITMALRQSLPQHEVPTAEGLAQEAKNAMQINRKEAAPAIQSEPGQKRPRE
jgi:hypothetical protein